MSRARRAQRELLERADEDEDDDEDEDEDAWSVDGDGGDADAPPSETHARAHAAPAQQTRAVLPPPAAVEQYLSQVEEQLELVRLLDNAGHWGGAASVLRVAHDRVKQLARISDVALAQWEASGHVPPVLQEGGNGAAVGAPAAGGAAAAAVAAGKRKWARWTPEENERLVYALEMWPRNPTKVAEYVGTKTVQQIKQHRRKR